MSPHPSSTTTPPPPKETAVAKQKLFQKPRSTATASSPFKPPTSRNPSLKATSNDLPTRIAQLKTTILHTQSQLTETLEKYEAVKAQKRQAQHHHQQQQQDATKKPVPAKTQTITINPTISTQTPDLPSETTTAKPGTPFPPVLTSSQTSQLKDAQATLTQHIDLLKKYNALKDTGMMMMEIMAAREGRRVGEIMGERGVGED